MIYIAIPTVTTRLENCARWAIARTTPEPHRVIVARGRSHGENLDAAFAGLPEDATHMFTMDDDAAPLRVGWLSWLVAKCGSGPVASFWATSRGAPHPLGSLYRVAALRSCESVTFRSGKRWDTGELIPLFGYVAPKCDRPILPWWLATCDVAADDDGRPIYSHLGGGTIGHTWYHQGRLYPRIPTWLWPVLVKRYLRRFSSNGQSYCSRCGKVMYVCSSNLGLPVCVQCETPEEARTWRERMIRARELQAQEEAR